MVIHGKSLEPNNPLKKGRIMSNQTPQGREEVKIIITCENCGQKIRIPRRNKLIRVGCPKCKHEFDYQYMLEKSDEDVAKAQFSLSLKTAKNICPICQKDDQLIKVASIVDAGTHHLSGTSNEWLSDNYGGHWTNVPITATQRSELATKLALSAQPTKPSITIGTCFIWTLTFLFVPAVVFGFGLFVSIGMGSWGDKFRTFSGYLGCAIPVILFIIYLIWFIVARSKYAVDKPKWDRAWYIWNRLYFCYRDNKIYDPENGATLDVANLNKYIFSI
jgi:hypothetical protein